MINYNQVNFDKIEYKKNTQKYDLRKNSNQIGVFIFIYFCSLIGISRLTSYLLACTVDFGKSGVYDSKLLFLTSIVSAVASSLITSLLFCCFTRQKVSDLVMTNHVKFNIFIPVICIGMAAAMVSNKASDILEQNFSIFGIQNTVNFSNEVSSGIEIFLYFISTAVVPAFAEELAFRGIVIGTLKKYGEAFAIITSAIMFGAMHRNITQIVFAFILGLIFGFIACKTKSIIPTIAIHCINNAYAVVVDILNTTGIISERMHVSIYFLLVSVFCILGIVSLIYLIKNNPSFFKLTDETKYFCILSLKEKLRIFFLSPGVIIANSWFVFETITNLGVI